MDDGLSLVGFGCLTRRLDDDLNGLDMILVCTRPSVLVCLVVILKINPKIFFVI
jgi:hypothetical protein